MEVSVGKHRDMGSASPMTIRWVDCEGNLLGKTCLVRRRDYGLPPVAVAYGQTWRKGDV